ncbi:MAG TPA: hypothetical protein DCL73_03245 [Treponema sp.]|nr:hypothetical protein [Treponema sp.]
MADESEKKPEFVVHHKKQSAPEKGNTAASPEKKRVIIVKRAQKPNTENVNHEQVPASASNAVKIPVHTEDSSAGVQKKTESPAPSVEKKNVNTVENGMPSPAPVQKRPEQNAPSAEKDERSASSPYVVRSSDAHRKSFDFNSSRPNVKAGNLSDHSRGGYRGSYSGQGPQRNTGGYGQNRPYRDSTGFTGAQARAGYQNRERGPGLR